MSVWGSTSLQTPLTCSAAYQSAAVATRRQLRLLWSVHLFCLWGGWISRRGESNPEARHEGLSRRGARQGGGKSLSCLITCLTQHTTERALPPPHQAQQERERASQKTNRQKKIKSSAARVATVGHLKYGYLECVGCVNTTADEPCKVCCVARGVCRRRPRDWTNSGSFFKHIGIHLFHICFIKEEDNNV